MTEADLMSIRRRLRLNLSDVNSMTARRVDAFDLIDEVERLWMENNELRAFISRHYDVRDAVEEGRRG